MHELSVAMEVCRIAEERLGTAHAHRLRLVAIEVGDDAGLEPASLRFCLEALLAEAPFGEARPEIHRVSGDSLRIEYLEVENPPPDG